jgi:two-component system, NtrC family, response regulator HupR/HoxA
VPSPIVRTPRFPFITTVAVAGFSRCWTTNIGPGGLGLSAIVSGARLPAVGDELEVEVPLGNDGSSIRVAARIAWTGRVHATRLAFGVQFVELSAAARTTLAVFLAEHRPRVLVALASQAQRELTHQALRGMRVELVDNDDDPEVLRSCSSIVAFGDDPERIAVFVDAVADATSALHGEIPLAPITVCGEPDPTFIVRLVADGRIYQALRPPFEPTALRLAVERSCERWALQLELRWTSLQLEGLTAPRPEPARTPSSNRAAVVRESTAMKRVYELIATVAIHDVPVLLIGETGTGKELAAQEIHALSKRARTPFVTQDCGALTETLLESELFGHVRGAFTGATSDHPGLFQLADGGTIFLDEVQNTSPALQAKLLRLIEQGELRPIGGTKSRRVDVRLIAACNVNPRQAIKEQRFRADFFYRLNRFPIELPPLRDHREDILPLARMFLERMSAELGRAVPPLGPDVEEALFTYDWPGNIRELKNTIERALLLNRDGEPIRSRALPDEIVAPGRPAPASDDGGLDERVARFERTLIQETLDRHAGVIRRAAQELEVNAVTLSRKMRRLGLS